MKQGIFIKLLIFWIVNNGPKITTEYSSNQCYIKSKGTNRAICPKTTDSPVNCDRRGISVTSLTMYVVCHCNSTLQCGAGTVDCCSTETNVTTPIPDYIELLLNACKNKPCLTISLNVLPDTGDYYQVLKTTYSCDSIGNQSETGNATGMISTSRPSPADTSVCQKYGSEYNISTVPYSSRSSFTEKNEDEDSGFPTAGYVIIPLVMVLIAVVIGLVWRYRRKLFGKKDEESPYIKKGGTGQILAAAINKTYESSCITKSTEENPAYSEESGFDDYSEISTVENSISTNLKTEHNVLNLKNRSVESDPNYGILSARPVDPDAFYFQVQKQDNGTQGDPYNHIGQTYKDEGGNESTYNLAHFGAQGEHGEEDTYNHIERHKQSPSHKHVAV